MKEENKARFDNLINMIKDPVRRKQVDNLNEYLKEHSAYFIAPASPKYHNNWEEGLLEHCMNVAENALKLNQCFKANLNEEELIIAGLYHDLGKAYIEEDQPYYLIKEATPKQKEYGYVPYPQYEYNSAGQVFMSVPERSVRLVTQFVNISDACWQAIKGHDGQYVDENHHYAAKENPMLSILQYADNWAGFHMEGTQTQSSDGKSYQFVDYDKVGKHGYKVRESHVEV